MTYQLPSAGVTWSSVFRQLESNKQRLGIVDYSVSQTTLEQVKCVAFFFSFGHSNNGYLTMLKVLHMNYKGQFQLGVLARLVMGTIFLFYRIIYHVYSQTVIKRTIVMDSK